MPRLLHALAATFATAALSLAPASASHACDPGPIYLVTIEASDLPDCVEVRPRARTAIAPFNSKPDPTLGATLDLDNDCADALEIAVVECAACGEAVTIAAGAGGAFVVENRPQSDAINYDKHTKQSLRWVLGAERGTLTTDVTVHDDTDACRGAVERAADFVTGGCR